MSEFNKHPIDVVLPWLNPTDKWFAEYKKYCENENPCRIRDLNTMRPTLRGILKNLPWVRYIWLIVYDAEQIENVNWEELKDKKVKIIYHKDIIPSEFLPNFNSLIPEIFFFNNEEIAENILFMNDDMIFNHFMQENDYFVNDLPVHHKTLHEGVRPNSFLCTWDYILKSTERLFNKLTKKQYVCDNWHAPTPISKTMCMFIDYKLHNELYATCKNAKIRRRSSVSLLLLSYWLSEAYGKIVSKPIYDRIKRKVLVLKDTTTVQDIKNCLQYDIVCVNDSEWLVNNTDTVRKTIENVFK